MTNINDLCEFDITIDYSEGDCVLINGKPHHLFRNVYLNNDLIWTPFNVPPIGYVEVYK